MSEPIRATAPPAEREPAGKSPSSWAEVRRLARQVYGSQLRRLTLVNALGAAAAVCEVATLSLVLLAAQALMQGAKEATVPRLAEVGLPAVWAIDRLLLFAAAAVIVRLILRLGESWASARIAADYECDQRLRLAAALLRADWKSQSAEPSGRIQVLLTKHVLIAARTLFSLSAVTAAATNLCVLIVAAVVVDWQCAAAIFAVTSVVFILVRPLSSSAQRRNRSQMAIYSQFANDLGQGVALSRELRTFGVVEPFFRRIRTAIEQYRGFRVEQMLLNHVVGPLYQNLALLLLVGGMATIYFTGFQRLESLGFVVVMFVRSLAYGQQLQASVHAVHDGAPYLEELRDAEDAYAYAGVSNVGRRLPTVETIGMRDVEFAYDRRKPVLRNVTFEARRGELIGVAGPSGCGKTTLVQLLLRLYDADAGDVLINGRPCREFSAADWPSRFACVPQESLMFDDSLADCIRFFRDGFTDEQVHRAAERAHLHEEIAALPDGYATRAGERGRKLSGGQRQRLSLARAVAGRPDVLVLDEPTGALDVAAEAAVLQTLLELRGEVTSFIVSHRPSTLQVCDRVLLLKDGRVQSFDSPERLSEYFPPFTADVASST